MKHLRVHTTLLLSLILSVTAVSETIGPATFGLMDRKGAAKAALAGNMMGAAQNSQKSEAHSKNAEKAKNEENKQKQKDEEKKSNAALAVATLFGLGALGTAIALAATGGGGKGLGLPPVQMSEMGDRSSRKMDAKEKSDDETPNSKSRLEMSDAALFAQLAILATRPNAPAPLKPPTPTARSSSRTFGEVLNDLGSDRRGSLPMEARDQVVVLPRRE